MTHAICLHVGQIGDITNVYASFVFLFNSTVNAKLDAVKGFKSHQKSRNLKLPGPSLPGSGIIKGGEGGRVRMEGRQYTVNESKKRRTY